MIFTSDKILIIKNWVMKKVIFLALVITFCSITLQAQEYRTAIGIRGGFYSGLTLKRFITDTNAFEAVVAAHYRGVLVAGMYQIHRQAFDAPGLYWYYGGGAFAGFYNRADNPWFDSGTGNFTTLGILGVFGLEYKIDEIPITIGIDITPAFNLFGNLNFWYGSGLTLRYTLN
jgi:hypothetical protein